MVCYAQISYMRPRISNLLVRHMINAFTNNAQWSVMIHRVDNQHFRDMV